MAQRWDIVVIGGGIAGLATAFELAKTQAPDRRILLLDREAIPGFYASGHNAGMARQLTGWLEHSRLAVEGRNRLADAGLLKASGGHLLAMDASALDELEAEAKTLGVMATRSSGAGLESLEATEHLSIPSDGLIDVHGLLGLCARGARESGVSLQYSCAVETIEVTADGFRIETTQGLIETSTLINAAGAWAGELGQMAGGLDIAFRPLRRHLAWSDQPHAEDQPYAWWVDRPLYLKPESGGLLMCPCDEDEVPLPSPGRQPEINSAIFDHLATTMHHLAPGLTDHGITRAWSGLRTFAPDRKFVIGWDPVNPRLFWVAGLGGHGMTTGLAVGKLAAELFQQRGEHGLSPARWRTAEAR